MVQAEASHKLREQFLTAFVYSLIDHSISEQDKKWIAEQSRLYSSRMRFKTRELPVTYSVPQPQLPAFPSMPELPSLPNLPTPQNMPATPLVQKQRPTQRMAQNIPTYNPSQPPRTRQPPRTASPAPQNFSPRQRAPPPMAMPPMSPSSQHSSAPEDQSLLGKVSPLLKDPSVLSIECPGPGKKVLVNRSGAIQATNLTLTKEEIDKIMNNVSTETKIPIIPGLFKTVMGSLIVTAVVSEFVGTRFIIQKRNPFQRY